MASLDRIFTLSANKKEEEIGTPITTQKLEYAVDDGRIPLVNLSQVYIKDPITFNAVNLTTQIIINAGYTLTSKLLDPFLENVGEVGNPTTWNEIVDIIYRHSFIYGSAWIEKVYNTKGTAIVDLVPVNPEVMDYANDSNRRPALDTQGSPLGYVQKYPVGIAVPQNQIYPKGVVLNPNEVFVAPEHMAHITLYTVGDMFRSYGLIEPGYWAIRRRLELEEGYATALDKSFPVRVGSYGDQLNRPTPQKMQKLLTTISNLRGKTDSVAIPNYVELSMLESKGIEKLLEPLNYYLALGIAGLGMPKAFAVGIGEGVNRSTLNIQRDVMGNGIGYYITRITSQIEKNIFIPICKKNFPTSNKIKYPKFKWNTPELKLDENLPPTTTAGGDMA